MNDNQIAIDRLKVQLSAVLATQRNKEMGKAGMLDNRVAGVLPVDERYADAVIEAIAPAYIDRLKSLKMYKEIVFALVQREGGEVDIRNVEAPTSSAILNYRYEDFGVKVKVEEGELDA